MAKNNTTFPSPLAPDKDKNKPSFGERVAAAILNSTSSSRAERDRIVANNRLFAKGKQPIKPYLDQLTEDGHTTYNNIIYSPRPIVAKFEEIVVNGYMEQTEYPKVTSMSKHVKDRKDRKRDEAKFRMQYKDLIAEVSQASGLPMEDPSAFVPRTEEELDVWFNMNDKEKEEILMQRMLTFVAEDIDLEELKQKVLSEQFQAGLHGVYSYLDRRNRLKVDFIPAEDCVYGPFSGEKSKNLPYAGRFLRYTVSDIRARWGLTEEQEEDLFKCAGNHKGKFGNPNTHLSWSNSYRTSNSRPYDSWTVPVFHCWWKCNKVETYIEGKDRYKRTVFSTFKDEDEVRPSDNKSIGKIYSQTAYEGYFLHSDGNTGTSCLEWGEVRNGLRAGEDKEDVECPFIFRMPGNKGELTPISPVSKIIPDVMSVDLLDLKIKAAIARAAPSGYAVDFNSLLNVDLGDGVDTANPLTLMDIYRNTGWLFYNSKPESGDGALPAPISQNNTSFDPQITGFLELYNWHRNEIREILGINEFRDGSATNPRIGYRYAQAQLSQSNTATLSLYRAWLTTGSELFRHIGIRIWDSLVFGTPNKGYLKFLGEKDADFIKYAKEITASSYDIKYEMGMTAQDREELEANIQTGIAAGTIDVVDAIAIRSVDDIVLANQILRVRAEMKRRDRMEEAEQNSRMSAEANAQAGQAVEQAKSESAIAIAQMQAQVKQTQGEQERDKEMEKLVWDLIRSEAAGQPIPEQYQGLVEIVLSNRGLNQSAELGAKTQEAQAQEEEAMMMEQMQAEGNPPM